MSDSFPLLEDPIPHLRRLSLQDDEALIRVDLRQLIREDLHRFEEERPSKMSNSMRVYVGRVPSPRGSTKRRDETSDVLTRAEREGGGGLQSSSSPNASQRLWVEFQSLDGRCRSFSIDLEVSLRPVYSHVPLQDWENHELEGPFDTSGPLSDARFLEV